MATVERRGEWHWGGGAFRPRHPAARAIVATAGMIVAPAVALAAALAGIVFVLLLPVCGIASLAEGFAKAAWDAARSLVQVRRRGVMPQD
jgi:hypothetical protein